jgi:subtilisin-like proprotein convertase family protein
MKKIFLIVTIVWTCLSFSQTFNGTGGVITDNQQNIDFPLLVNGLSQTTLDANLGLVQVCLNINHTWDSDLKASLIAPDGTTVTLFAGVGGDQDNFTNTCLSQSSTNLINNNSAPFSGTFKPEESIGNLNNGQNGNGMWTLRIVDVFGQDEGTLLNWSLSFGNNASTPFFFTSSNLPIVIINTDTTILDEPAIIGTMKIIDNGTGAINYTTDTPNNYNGNISIELRGNYSQSLPQKPYKLTTLNADSTENNVSLLGMPSEHDWALVANYNDKVFMRNQLAYKLFSEMGHYATRNKFCEVVVNGSYQGIYLLNETIKRDNNRVNIAKLEPTENTGIDLTGGYIIKNDYWDTTNGWQLNHNPIDHPDFAVGLAYQYPRPDLITPEQKSYIQDFIDQFETALYSPDFADPNIGYKKYLSETSFLDYFIINELSRNNDGFKKSSYFHKDKDSTTALAKLKAGPVWDFDWAWKNINECSIFAATDGSGWAYQVNDCYPDVNSPGWYVRLLQDPNFQNDIRCRWNTLRTTTLSLPYIFTYIDETAAYLDQAQARHFEKWSNLGIPTGTPEIDPDPNTFAGQVAKFKSWIATRIAWLDDNIPGDPSTCALNIMNPLAFNVVVQPNPANNLLNIKANNDTLKKVELWDVSGKVILERTLNETELSINLENIKSGIYFCKIENTQNAFVVKKVIIAH